MRSLVEFLARSLVDDPKSVAVSERDAEATTVYELKVGSDDIGKVIGKHGRTAHAMRLLLSAAAQRHGRRVALEIKE
jgi:predicted RNA-binding protein YlqC (UPF0109 family)